MCVGEVDRCPDSSSLLRVPCAIFSSSSGGLLGPELLVRDDRRDLSVGRVGLDQACGVGRDSLDLTISVPYEYEVLCYEHTRWKPLRFLWQVIWKTDDEPCRATLRGQRGDMRESRRAHMTE
jgi:hypothetical protein